MYEHEFVYYTNTHTKTTRESNTLTHSITQYNTMHKEHYDHSYDERTIVDGGRNPVYINTIMATSTMLTHTNIQTTVPIANTTRIAIANANDTTSSAPTMTTVATAYHASNQLCKNNDHDIDMYTKNTIVAVNTRRMNTLA